MSTFDTRKKEILEKISCGVDKSFKQCIDEKAIRFVQLLNDSRDFYTTSSCSGRISVLRLGKQIVSDETASERGCWIFSTHDIVSKEESVSLAALFSDDSTCCNDATGECFQEAFSAAKDELIYFKFEPFILHVECRDQASAQKLLRYALQAGYRNSGATISSRIIVAIRHTAQLNVPIAFTCSQHQKYKLLVSAPYLSLLLAKANEFMLSNFERIDVLYEQLSIMLSSGISENEPPKESKEERKARKKAEGLLKQKLLRTELEG
jgi:tRNA wybutosine-synthesizing protein 3